MDQSSVFSRFARTMSRMLGHPIAFGLAVLLIIVWLISGPIFGFSDTWQLVINTGTTIITFLMVFLIQNSQNRDSEAVQIKLDELILALKRADDRVLDTEDLTDHDLEKLQEHYTHLAHLTNSHLSKRKSKQSDASETAQPSHRDTPVMFFSERRYEHTQNVDALTTLHAEYEVQLIPQFHQVR